jgi:hypothetical protein
VQLRNVDVHSRGCDLKATKTIQIPAKTETVFDYLKCDLCGTISHDSRWSSRQYEVTQPEVTLRVGDNYPEGGNTKETILDICPDCFEKKLIPWFKSQGGTPRIEEHDW